MLLLLLLSTLALAYETDQLTDRELPLVDATAALDAWTTHKLLLAAAEVRRRTSCRGSDRRVRRKLARTIHDSLASKVYLPGRGLVAGLGYDRVMAFLEESPGISRRRFVDRDDIFSLAKVDEAPVLNLAGPCSTVLIGGVRMGTDKPSHFVDVGYDYFRRSRNGRRPDRAVRWGTNTERRFYGLLTSSAFSFADLRANLDGYRFYAGLLGEDSPLQRDEDGCVQLVAAFRWAAQVDWEYDELLNPSVYTAGARRAISRFMDRNPEAVCRSWASVEPDQRALLAQSLGHASQDATDPLPYASDKAPPRKDALELASRCDSAGPPPVVEQTPNP